MQLQSWALTDVGRSRKHNEDGWLIDEQIGLYAVADGMGGHAAGEVASAHVLRSLQETLTHRISVIEDFSKRPSREGERALLLELDQAVSAASGEIFEMAQRDKRRHGMGTTLSMLLMAGDKAFMAHVGDSRIYLLRSAQIHQISEDHSYLWEQVKRGEITEEEAKASPFSNVITRAVGITDKVQVDTLVLDVLPGDIFLACSDGLHGYFERPDELLEVISSTEVEDVPRRLVGMANARGGKDNITVVVVHSASESSAAVEPSLQRLGLLKRVSLFKDLNFAELLKLVPEFEAMECKPGENLCEQGEEADVLFVIQSGEVEVHQDGQALSVAGPGDCFGEMGLVDATPRSSTVTSREACSVLALHRDAFLGLLRREPELGCKLLWALVQVLNHRLRLMTQ